MRGRRSGSQRHLSTCPSSCRHRHFAATTSDWNLSPNSTNLIGCWLLLSPVRPTLLPSISPSFSFSPYCSLVLSFREKSKSKVKRRTLFSVVCLLLGTSIRQDFLSLVLIPTVIRSCLLAKIKDVDSYLFSIPNPSWFL